MLFLLACAEPFEHDASDLIGARIASVSLEDGIMVWSGEGLYHRNQPDIKWYNFQRKLLRDIKSQAEEAIQVWFR